MSLDVVSGARSSLADLKKDEAWLRGWLQEKPSRLGLGALTVASGDPAQDDAGNPAFLATDDRRYFCVNVRLGELEAAHGFGVLDAWARNRVRHPDRDHVAVLVTESVGDRYRSTLRALAEHLPLVVVELQVWQGESEAIVVPHVALASQGAESGSAAAASPAAASPAAASPAAASPTVTAGAVQPPAGGKPAQAAKPVPSAEERPPASPPAEKAATASSGGTGSKDDTGVQDPWGLPQKEPEATATPVASNGNRLLTKFNT